MTRVAKSVQEIIDWAESFEGQKIYRGQIDTWDLKASLFRTSLENQAHYEENFDKTSEVFKRKAQKYLSFEPKSAIEWMSIAQHHGIKTPLIDWTTSVLTAAYFACKEMSAGEEKRQAVIFSIDRPSEGINDDSQGIVLYIPSDIHARAYSQYSCMTLQKKSFIFESCSKLFIDKESEGKIKIQLSKLGIDSSSIFPDLGGLGAALDWKLKWKQPL